MTTPETQAASASAVLSTALGDLIEAVRGTAARVRALPVRGGTTDERAVHDVRVALRRLRTALPSPLLILPSTTPPLHPCSPVPLIHRMRL